MSSIFTLPPVPPELKAVSPFLSRAEELAKQDPIISYWCEDLCP
jgi:vacuolar protein sorting-associated protein VTA1